MPMRKFLETNHRFLIDLAFFTLKILGIIVIIGILVLIILPIDWNQAKHREEARVIFCRGMLKLIYHHIRLYADDNSGWFPCHLTDLNEPDPMIFNCRKSAFQPGAIDYHYQPGINVNDKVVRRLIWDKRSNHKNFINILYSDGNIKSEKK